MSGGGVMLSGWLRKSPPEKKMKRHHSWKKRWFVLKSGRLTGDPNVLEYYKHQASRKPIKSINLNDCTQIQVNVPIKPDKKDPGHQFVFGIVTGSRTFYLVGDSIREMSSWVHCLCDLCGFNHDSNEKGDLGTEYQTFKADPLNRNINGTASATMSLLPNHDVADTVDAPPPLPRPENTLTPLSKPVAHHSSNNVMNGTVNARTATNENGYDFPQEDGPFGDGNIGLINESDQVISRRPNRLFNTPKLAIPSDDPDSNGYLHLADCETATENSGFLDVGKMDERRSSTDSVFTHEGGADDVMEEPVNPAPDIFPNRIPQNSRFLQKVQQGRLSSMPDCPPPPPPTNVPPLRLGNFSPPDGDDDEDGVVDARRKPLSRTSTGIGGQLAPIGDSDLYKVPLNLQREHNVDEDGTPWSGNSSSSYGSAMEGRRFSGKAMPSGPEYINTSESKGSGSFSGPSGGNPLSSHSASSNFSSPIPTPGSASYPSSRMLYDVPSPLSPIFPIITSSPRTNYQVPQSSEQSRSTRSTVGYVSQSSAFSAEPAFMAPSHQQARSDAYVKKQLAAVPMLDVGGITSPQQSLSPGVGDIVSYSSPNSFSKTPYQAMYSTPTDYRKGSDSGNGMNVESSYAVPPARPPKPTGAHMGQPTGVGSTGTESMYSMPRTHSSSSSSSYNRDHMQTDNATYDTVKQPSPLSPPHSTVVGTLAEEQGRPNKLLPLCGGAKQRNAISASNSPLATPDMGRRVGIGKTHSFNSKISPPMQKNKLISGSAPSIYDVPQRLQHSPAPTDSEQMRGLSQSSSTSAESGGINSTQNTAAENSIYDAPRRLHDPINGLPTKDVLQKVDDVVHPSYEKMATQHLANTELEEACAYTTMAGAMTTTPTMLSRPPQMHPPLSRSVDTTGPQDLPPPVHRDLKPGRRSLGSDGGSSQPGSDRRMDNYRDSYESDEAVSPPHTSIVHTMPMVNEPKSYPRFATNNFSPTPSPQPSGSRSNSITSPQHNKSGRMDNFGDRLSVSPVPPQRPPKSSHSSLSPRSPPMSTPLNHLPGRPYTPTHAGHMSPQVAHDRPFMTPSPSLTQGVPERPPKPANMKRHQDMSNTQVWDDGGFSLSRRTPRSGDDVGFLPSRPPKPSMTPSSGDSLLSSGSLHSGSFFPQSGSSFSMSALVPPPPAEQLIEKEIKYIEIKDFPTQSENIVHPPSDERATTNESVEYIQLDVDKTRALEKSKMERQNKLQERANFDMQHAFSKGKDKYK